MKHALLIAGLLALLMTMAACQTAEFSDGYQFGDITRFTARELLQLQAARDDYCSKTADSALKQLAITAIQTQLPAYPESGICTDALAELVNQQAE